MSGNVRELRSCPSGHARRVLLSMRLCEERSNLAITWAMSDVRIVFYARFFRLISTFFRVRKSL